MVDFSVNYTKTLADVVDGFRKREEAGKPYLLLASKSPVGTQTFYIAWKDFSGWLVEPISLDTLASRLNDQAVEIINGTRGFSGRRELAKTADHLFTLYNHEWAFVSVVKGGAKRELVASKVTYRLADVLRENSDEALWIVDGNVVELTNVLKFNNGKVFNSAGVQKNFSFETLYKATFRKVTLENTSKILVRNLT